jgi:hypothetical protein
MVCWNGAIALAAGVALEVAAAFEYPNVETVGLVLAIVGAALIICSVYWFSRPPCEQPDDGAD